MTSNLWHSCGHVTYPRLFVLVVPPVQLSVRSGWQLARSTARAKRVAIIGVVIVHELTRDECDGVLSRMHIGRLACARFNQPYVVPVSFVFDSIDRSLVGFSLVGQKVQWMRDNPRVCVEVDEIVDDIHWTTVIVNGLFREIGSADGAELARAQELLQARVSWWLPGTAKPAHGAERATPLFYRDAIREMTGRRTSATHR